MFKRSRTRREALDHMERVLDTDPAIHAYGHDHLVPPRDVPDPASPKVPADRNQPWIPKNGLIDRLRRSARRQ